MTDRAYFDAQRRVADAAVLLDRAHDALAAVTLPPPRPPLDLLHAERLARLRAQLEAIAIVAVELGARAGALRLTLEHA